MPRPRLDRKENNTVFAAALKKLRGRVVYVNSRNDRPGGWMLDDKPITNEEIIHAAYPEWAIIDDKVRGAVEKGWLGKPKIRIGKKPVSLVCPSWKEYRRF